MNKKKVEKRPHKSVLNSFQVRAALQSWSKYTTVITIPQKAKQTKKGCTVHRYCSTVIGTVNNKANIFFSNMFHQMPNTPPVFHNLFEFTEHLLKFLIKVLKI